MAELTQPATVLSVTDLTPHVRQLVLFHKHQRILFQPGQWVSLKLPVGPKPPLNRAYSLAAPSTASGELTLVFDRVIEGIGIELPLSGSRPVMRCCCPAPMETSRSHSHSIEICSLSPATLA